MLEFNNVAYELNVEIDLPPINTIGPKRKPKHFQYARSNEVLLDPKNKYKMRVLFQNPRSDINFFKRF